MTDLNQDPRHDAKVARGLRWTLENTLVDLRDAAARAEIAPGARQEAPAGPVTSQA